MDVAVLFARCDSVYKTLPGCDVWDIERDARLWPGGSPVVAHPPCRAWGSMRQFAKPREDEKALALFALDAVRKWGGVLEHPAESTLYAAAKMPAPGRFPDEFGGWSFAIDQFHFGHRAEKATWLYVVGIEPDELPPPSVPGRQADALHQADKELSTPAVSHEGRTRTYTAGICRLALRSRQEVRKQQSGNH